MPDNLTPRLLTPTAGPKVLDHACPLGPGIETLGAKLESQPGQTQAVPRLCNPGSVIQGGFEIQAGASF